QPSYLFYSPRCHRPRSTLFPYTTLFRSLDHGSQRGFFRIEQIPHPAVVFFSLRHEAGRVVLNHVSLFRQAIGELHEREMAVARRDRKSTRLNSSHGSISYAVFCLKKKTT